MLLLVARQVDAFYGRDLHDLPVQNNTHSLLTEQISTRATPLLPQEAAPLYPSWEVHNDDHSHISFDNFLSRYNMIFESCFPMKSLYSLNKKNLGKKWVTQGMQILSARKRVFYTIAPQ